MAGEAGLEGVIGCRCAGERRPAARVQRHPPRLGRRRRRGLTRNATCRWLSTSRGTARRPTPNVRSRSPAASPTCSPPAPSASCCAATRRGAHRSARRAGSARAREQARARLDLGGDRGRRRAGRAPPLRPPARRRARIGSRSRTSSSAGAPSRCSPANPPRSAASHAKISAATVPTRSPRRFEASAPGRWSRSGTGSAELADAGHACSSALATRSTGRSAQRMTELLPDAQLVVAPGGHGLPLENPAARSRRRARRRRQ